MPKAWSPRCVRSILGFALWLCVGIAWAAESAEPIVPQADLAGFKQSILPVLQQSCVPCHGADVEEGNIRVDTLDPDLLHGADVDWWVEVLAVLNNGEMPPPDEAELSDEDRSRVVEWLSNEIQVASKVRRANGGHSAFRRLTRYEYNHALQDILGLPWDFAKDLPPEAHSPDGFQNSSDMLHMSVTQFETYRQLARKALLRATVVTPADDASTGPPPTKYWGITMQDAAQIEWRKQAAELDKVRKEFAEDADKQQQEIERLNASFQKRHSRPYFYEPASGRTALASWAYHGAKYAFAPSDVRPQMPDSFDCVAILPSGGNSKLIVELGDQIPDEGIMRVRVRAAKTSATDAYTPSMQLEFGWRASNEGRADMRVSTHDIPVTASPDDPQVYQWDVPLGDIYPRNSVRKVSPMGAMPSPSEYIRLVNSSVSKGDIQVDYVEVATPVYDHWPPRSHTQIFIASEHRDDESDYAREVLQAFMTRAWRRSVSAADVEQKLKLFRALRAECGSFEEAMVEVLATVLSSPHFLYVVETAPTESLSSHQLATRLALFLWSSVPDDRLLELANSGQLADADVLAQQVTRMLADPRAQRLSQHFVHQWLDMQLLDFLSVDRKSSGLSLSLKEAMQREPVALFEEMLRDDESVLNFIDSDYAMVNERLARHYGIRGVSGNHFRRVALDGDPRRGGLLTHAGLLAMNSDGKDSHPLKRGVWLLESILNDPPPPPPPAVPEIDLADPRIAKMTLKQRIEDHRNHAACMSCHAKIDPWGIAFENYDALGRWRDQVNGQPIDASSRLFNNELLDGVEGLKRYLLENRQDQFVRAMVYKLTTYALGRPLAFSDRASIDQITRDVRQQGDGLATMIRAIVTSDLFQTSSNDSTDQT
ncbi:DUF1592 domain-containing protein [Roseimaritima ulvae]|uniref:Planctomycete cytochrome C n=1 Tax=Roseimaritima ulvae TaxID=980254 RepID=A0A5B9QZ22_9BACT|nr:DUF1592 domain-containing protein [Roseimaritima ulvae]QEG39233.1 hypothetical protein UC8_11940 [Roseimaritima ulvae]